MKAFINTIMILPCIILVLPIGAVVGFFVGAWAFAWIVYSNITLNKKNFWFWETLP